MREILKFCDLCRYDLLLLDELGSLTLKKEQMNAFFKLMKERYEAGHPTIITTNLQPEQWYSLLEPKDMIDALLDRLNHRCINIMAYKGSPYFLYRSFRPLKFSLTKLNE
ncbi:conserved hypothetical protein [delta proteobacterium NaphS2]|nr:conserved hypothetical protein [delta proteobacterium NaphS2]